MSTTEILEQTGKKKILIVLKYLHLGNSPFFCVLLLKLTLTHLVLQQTQLEQQVIIKVKLRISY